MSNTSTNFGRDISCTDSIRTGRFSSGPRLVAEACYRRLRTPRGTLRGGEEEQNYGFDLSQKVGTIATDAEAAALPGQIESELTKDDRLLSVVVDVVKSQETNGATTWTITVEGQTADGPFTLQLAVSEVTVQLLGITAAEAA